MSTIKNRKDSCSCPSSESPPAALEQVSQAISSMSEDSAQGVVSPIERRYWEWKASADIKTRKESHILAQWID